MIIGITLFCETGAAHVGRAPVSFYAPADSAWQELPLTIAQQHKVAWLRKHIPGFAKSKKITAIALAIALGPFGVHRLYLGTRPLVPVVYTLTLGGGMGILPLTDIIAILLTPDLSQFENNDGVIMWLKK